MDRIQMIGGDAFVSLSYSGDRGFAKYVGGDMKASNPLVGFSWLEEALKLRNDAVNKEFDKLATEKLPGHVSGSALTLKQRMALASELPETVGLTFPALATHSACEAVVAMESDPRKMIAIKCTADALSYVRAAMIASKTEESRRARPRHSERLSEATGIKGVHRRKGRVVGRLAVKWCDADGRKRVKTANMPEEDAGATELASTCKRLKKHAERSADDPSPAKGTVQSVHSDAEKLEDSCDDGDDGSGSKDNGDPEHNGGNGAPEPQPRAEEQCNDPQPGTE